MSRDESTSRWFEPALFQHLPPEECRDYEFLESGWSVLAVGDADLVDDPDLLVELWGDEGPKPWAVGLRTQFVRIRPIRVTGRRVVRG